MTETSRIFSNKLITKSKTKALFDTPFNKCPLYPAIEDQEFISADKYKDFLSNFLCTTLVDK